MSFTLAGSSILSAVGCFLARARARNSPCIVGWIFPNSVSGLSPNNPSLKIVNSARITAPYHSIIGDRGKGDSPNSTDGVVPYSSSHLDGAKSELIVPGPHGSCNLPQTIGELKRILRLHLRASADSTTAVAQASY
jgi:hypothetical protein